MARYRGILVPLLAGAVLLAGCGEQGGPAPGEPDEAASPEDDVAEEQDEALVPTPAEDGDVEPPSGSPSDEPAPEGGEESPTGDGAQPQDLSAEIEFALSDAASTSGVAQDEIRVLLAEHVTWNDGALGCPEPGGMYTQALVDGYRILLSVDGEEWAYHGQDGQEPFHCENPREPYERGSGGTVDR